MGLYKLVKLTYLSQGDLCQMLLLKEVMLHKLDRLFFVKSHLSDRQISITDWFLLSLVVQIND